MMVVVSEVFNQAHKTCKGPPNKLAASRLMRARYCIGPALLLIASGTLHSVARNDEPGARVMKLITCWLLSTGMPAHVNMLLQQLFTMKIPL